MTEQLDQEGFDVLYEAMRDQVRQQRKRKRELEEEQERDREEFNNIILAEIEENQRHKHQLTKKELSFGTLGPSLAEYGKLRDYKEADVKAAYEKIYNSHAALPCSNMPRFGANKILTVDQIKDAVALLMSKDSPVNTGQ